MLYRLCTLCLLITLIGCGGNDCEISDLEVSIGECSCEDAYSLTIDFNSLGSDSDFFELFTRNGVLIGHYKLSDLPITIDKFQMSGLADDYIKIRLNEDDECSKEYEFFPPECTSEDGCSIDSLEIKVGECFYQVDTSYQLVIDFEYQNANNELFDVFTRNEQLLDFFKLADLPITINDFVSSGQRNDYLKICINDNPDCCREIEFNPPACIYGECEVYNLVAIPGECTSKTSYKLKLNFNYSNPYTDQFDVFVRNNVKIGTFSSSFLQNNQIEFEVSGKADDYVKVCFQDNPDCCQVLEFMPPVCDPGDCEITELNVDIKECTTDSTYNLVLDFEYENPGNDYFDLYARQGIYLGHYKLADLPIEIIDFKKSWWSDYDYLKVCINDVPNCCREIEFMSPNCDHLKCEIFDLTVDIGACDSNNSYNLVLDFDYVNPSHSNFELFDRNYIRIGNYPLSALPLTLTRSEMSGEDYDLINVCMSDSYACCDVIEFMPPDCDPNDCEINEINVNVKECTSDSTYNIVLDFEYENPGNEYFDVFIRQGVHLGYYKLSDLPIELIDFRISWHEYDYIKVCINDVPNCCREEEFMPPDC